jgi:hypothetical protein
MMPVHPWPVKSLKKVERDLPYVLKYASVPYSFKTLDPNMSKATRAYRQVIATSDTTIGYDAADTVPSV